MSAHDFNKWVRDECPWASRSYDSDGPPKLVRSDSERYPWMIEIATVNASDFIEILAQKFQVRIPQEQTGWTFSGDFFIYLTQAQKARLSKTCERGGPH